VKRDAVGPSAAVEEGPARFQAPPRASDLVPVVGVAVSVLLFFVVLYPALGLRVPIGSDSPVYVWWSRYAGAAGLGSFETGTRPAIVGLVAAVAGISRLQAAAVTASLSPVLAVSLSLAAAAFGAGSVAHPRPRTAFSLAGVLVGVSLGFLVPGYLSTLAFLSPFLAALAVLAFGCGRRGARLWLGTGLLLVAAGLSHPLFLLLGAGICGGAALALIPGYSADRIRAGSFADTALGRLTLTWCLALPSIAIGLVMSGAGTGPTIDTSRDAVLRRTGLGALLRASYRRKLAHDAPWWRWVSALLLALTAISLLASRQGRARERDDPIGGARAASFWGAIGAWLAITLGGVALLAFGASAAPGQRLVDVCLPLPILAGLGLAAVSFRRRWLTGVAIAGGVALFVASIGSAWLGSRPLTTPEQAEQARSVGAALARTAPGTPLVLVLDDRSDKPALFVTRYANDVLGAVPAARIPDVHVFVGRPADLVGGRPTLTGDPEHDRLARDYWRRVRPALGRRPLVVSVRSFDRAGFASASALRGAQPIAPGVVALPSWTPRPVDPARLPGPLGEPGAGPMSPWLPVGFAAALLAVFAAIGWPWSRLTLPAAAPANAGALAPALGAAALALGAVLADAAGLRLSGSGAIAALLVALLGWPLRAWASARRRGSPGSTGGGPARAAVA
jgi:hypothetical protein